MKHKIKLIIWGTPTEFYISEEVAKWNLTLYKLDLIMEGQLQDVIEALKVAAGEQALKEAT